MALVNSYDHIVASITSKPPPPPHAEDVFLKGLTTSIISIPNAVTEYGCEIIDISQSCEIIDISQLVQANHDDQEAEVFRCVSCFSVFIPTGIWFKRFRIFGGKNDNKDVQNENRRPVLATTTKTMAVEQGTEYTYEFSASQYMVSEHSLLEANPGDQNSLTTVTKHHHEENVFPLEEAAPELIEYDVERVLKKQDTHDLYCPNCNSCITRRVILRKRQWIIKENDQKPKPTADPKLDTISEELSHSIIPTGNAFKLLRISGGKNDNKDVQNENQPPVSTTTTKTMAVEQGMIDSEEVSPLEEAAPKLIEYDVESVLKKQDTHDLYCPNCNSCITRKVILRKRKRMIKESDQKPKREKLEAVADPMLFTDKRDHIVVASITSKPPAEDATA